jgi:hypothetical protein
MKLLKTIPALLFLGLSFTFFNCKKKYERPDQYSVDLFENEQKIDDHTLSKKDAFELSKAVIKTDSVQLLDQSKLKNKSTIFIYKIEKGNVEKGENDSIKFPLNILTSTKIETKAKPISIYLVDLTLYRLMVRDFNIKYQTISEKVVEDK